ncbi:hypothetical protein [Janthinobacterium agaricidamnosum]|uniref:hypothetical protein n=1 Tax=Janthinobacterium agaricidamnosum TaxID=55508 RepID=UPI0011862BC3|nr:hypothetical protein [Janthinobacterium agaricidamnosum]
MSGQAGDADELSADPVRQWQDQSGAGTLLPTAGWRSAAAGADQAATHDLFLIRNKLLKTNTRIGTGQHRCVSQRTVGKLHLDYCIF